MIELNNLTTSSVREETLKEIARWVIKKEAAKEFRLSIALVSPERMKELNNKYLNRNYVTDVLAFSSPKNFPPLSSPQTEALGEIVICPFQVRANSKKAKSNFHEELSRVLIHGILHLFGYSHEKSCREKKKMLDKENSYLAETFKKSKEDLQQK